jgi:hypothetical protein
VKEGKLTITQAKLFKKNVCIPMGRDDKRWNSKLRDMILNDVAKPSQSRQSPSLAG